MNRGKNIFIDSQILSLVADGSDADMNALVSELFGDELKLTAHG